MGARTIHISSLSFFARKERRMDFDIPAEHATAKSFDEQLAGDIMQYHDDPDGFVKYIFPWGKKGTRLAEFDGPDVWQSKYMNTIKEEIQKHEGPIQLAVSSGHGIGKGTEVAWIILWFISTRSHPQIVVTSNTKTQLLSKTWRELSKWHKLALNGHWFEWTATTFYYKAHPETWKAFAIPWSENNPEAFAGTHEEDVLVIYDEASSIEDIIWETTEGAMTTPGAMWLVYGNPTRTSGRFRECFGKFRHRWRTFQIDSRTAKMTDKKQIQRWVDDYGEDSDFCRVRVKGEFPRASAQQLIPTNLVDEAARRNYKQTDYQYAPVIIGVDVARYGDDQSTITVRQGIKQLELMKYREINTMELAAHVCEVQDKYRNFPVYTFVDVVGIGAGVVDRLRLLGRSVFEVNAGYKATDRKYFNKRAQMWSKCKEWLELGGQIIDDPELKDDLTGPEYGYNQKMQLQIERKEDMKDRGLASPDCGESLVHTFYFDVYPLEDADDNFDDDNLQNKSEYSTPNPRSGY